MKKLRCAIYTRKSSEDGLEQEFNSLDAQREACAAYIAIQIHEGWVLLSEQYDDGGMSGGSLERPALQRLLQHIKEGSVDQIVVYKIDRLTRSLTDFSKIVDTLDAAEASFVSVTQSFNTATSMGRLTLNMLLSFAQFEQEVTAERIRDKIAASKRKGLWMGEQVPLGYDADGRTLKINDPEAKIISTLFELYQQLGTVRAVKVRAKALDLRTRRRMSASGEVSGGGMFDRGHIHHILTNPLYAGRIRHKGEVFEGQHEAIIDPERWDRIQRRLKTNSAKSRGQTGRTRSSPLCGKIFDETGDRLTPSHTKTKAGVRLRYYVSHRLIGRSGEKERDGWRLPAEDLEQKISHLVRQHLGRSNIAGQLINGSPAAVLTRCKTALKQLCNGDDPKVMLDLINRIDLKPGDLQICIDREKIAAMLKAHPYQMDPYALEIRAPFQLRKRGVETKLIFADAAAELDQRLLTHIAKAHVWFEQIKRGTTIAEIAESEQTSKRRIQQLIDLAFLAPDIIRDVLDGKQPLGFRSDWCVRHAIPSDWSEQRALLATL